MMVSNENRSAVLLRIDNLPPGKSWKQVKYLIGGIIHHSSVLKVKMLPLMSSIVPPFVPFQSCVVSLRSNLDPNSLNELLLSLNTFQWDYYNLYAYTLPQPFEMPTSPPMSSREDNASNGENSQSNSPGFMYPPVNMMAPPRQPSGPMMGGIPQMPGPLMGLPPHRRKYLQPPMNMFLQQLQEREATKAMMGLTLNSDSHPRSSNDILVSNGGVGGNGATSSRRLRQIFNEKSFRKQMTGRGMWQLQLDNFPPFLKLDTIEPLTEDDDKVLKEKGLRLIETDQPDKFGRLRWTVLKDFIKLKCPRLLNLNDPSSAQGGESNGDNTREFYVGVYEDSEEQVRLKVPGQDKADDKLNVVKSTVYKAIVGFNDKELCDMCLANLQGQEYSLGFKLRVKYLPPYDEHQDGGTGTA
ncbi:hypothetical protein HG536_0C04930 [Torulaspora globosa]|uniref:Uncharacterized protein n=1 Tax=Torulaspora globosa TaxID=48254 RepID=A0A7G3ZFN8_9SACH|nr:uncharacterized protein HG536_0C04930 [Torulaspora globosa]QLL32324.1 hypothetical protein HG536_0C04930 [Torulaspora globosa]